MCDGYEPKQTASKPLEYNSTQLFPVETTIKALSIIPGPTIIIPGTYQERRSFAFFCYQIGQQLSNALNIAQTHQLILQSSHCDEAVRSAAVALGSIGMRLCFNELLTLDSEQANSCHDFAHLQYYKALKRLRERISNDSEGSADLALILCYMFTVFEFLQGNDAGSLTHLRSGLNILRRDHGSLSTGLEMVSPDQDPLRHEMLRAFSVMDVEATMWLGLRTFQGPILMALDGPGDDPVHSDSFSTLDEAANSLKYQIDLIYHFRRLVAAYDCTEPPNHISPEVYTKKERLLEHLKKWPISFEALTARLGGEIDAEMSTRIIIMRMNYETNLMTFRACLQRSDEQIYGKCEAEFRLIVDLAKSVIGPTDDVVKLGVEHIAASVIKNNGGMRQPQPMFSFFAGIIRPLYHTAIECQNLRICREAITLLSSSPWREGGWDSATMARIAARRVKEVEERYMNTNPERMDFVAYDYAQRRRPPGLTPTSALSP